MHVHVGALEFLVFVAYLVLALGLLKVVAARFPDSPIVQTLLTIAD